MPKVPTAPPVVSSHNTNNFDFLRFLFATLVILSHSFIMVKGGWREPLEFLTNNQDYLGEVAVNGFFIISGFLITASWLRSKGFLDYLLKRILRIYPAFIVVCLLCALLIGPFASPSSFAYFHDLNTKSLIMHLLLLDKLDLPATFDHNHLPNVVNGSIWTIKIEFECYLLVALLGLLGAFRKRTALLIFTIAACASFTLLNVRFLHLHQFSESSMWHLRFGSYFLIGAVFYLFRDAIAYRPRYLACAVAALVVADFAHILTALEPIPFAYIIMYAAFSNQIKLHGFAKRGDFSYGLYLFAWPVQQLIARQFGGGALSPYTLFLLAFAVTLFFAFLSWFLIEKPFLKLKPKAMRSPKTEESRRGSHAVDAAPNSGNSDDPGLSKAIAQRD